jgi:hypothetical protein
MANGEYYISCVFDVMLRHGTPVKALHAPSRACLGTPGELQENVVMGRLTTSQKRFCFDLDGTLVTHPVVPGDYSSVKPINRTIEMLRELHNVGNHIIIYTARGMRTMNGDAERRVLDRARGRQKAGRPVSGRAPVRRQHRVLQDAEREAGQG